MESTTLELPELSHEENLLREVRSALRHRRHGAFNQVRIDAADGTVLLYGRVRSFYEKQLLLNAVAGVSGVEAIQDEVEVPFSR
jgi:osmotically-inducible protein OsmY